MRRSRDQGVRSLDGRGEAVKPRTAIWSADSRRRRGAPLLNRPGPATTQALRINYTLRAWTRSMLYTTIGVCLNSSDPDLDEPVGARRQQACALRVRGHAADGAAVRLEGLDHLRIDELPEVYAAWKLSGFGGEMHGSMSDLRGRCSGPKGGEREGRREESGA